MGLLCVFLEIASSLALLAMTGGMPRNDEGGVPSNDKSGRGDKIR